MGAPFAGLVFINPALDVDRAIAHQVGWIHVYHNKGDAPVETSEILDWLPWNWRSGHPWGSMGNGGYAGADARYRNFDCGLSFPPVSGHSAIFQQMAKYGPIIVSRVAAQSGVQDTMSNGAR